MDIQGEIPFALYAKPSCHLIIQQWRLPEETILALSPPRQLESTAGTNTAKDYYDFDQSPQLERVWKKQKVCCGNIQWVHELKNNNKTLLKFLER